MARAVNETRETELGFCLETARSFTKRAVGLMFRRGLPPGGGMIIDPCNSIHMFFMRFPLDVVFLDGKGRVVALYEGIKPWRISSIHWNAAMALELPVGTISRTGTVVGDNIRIEEDACEAS